MVFTGFVGATFSAAGVRTFLGGTAGAPMTNGQALNMTLGNAACAGLFSIEGMR